MNCQICGKPITAEPFVWNGKKFLPSIHVECESEAMGCAGRKAPLPAFVAEKDLPVAQVHEWDQSSDP